MAGLPFVKGHGTENDFVVLTDPEGTLELTPSLVVALCERRAGIGADGVLRAVRSAKHPDAVGMAADAEWFMDYRNADGGVVETCGNGLRVFVRHLVESGLAPVAGVAVATRGGVRDVRIEADGTLVTDMGEAGLPDLGDVRVRLGDREWPATAVTMPNPHAVVAVDDLAEAGDLREPPQVSPPQAYPDGVNVEFVAERGPRHLAMRVHERGVGETRSCGTGACAAAVALHHRRGGQAPAAYDVDVPGGRLAVMVRTDGHVELAGPAVLVASGELSPDWLADHR